MKKKPSEDMNGSKRFPHFKSPFKCRKDWLARVDSSWLRGIERDTKTAAPSPRNPCQSAYMPDGPSPLSTDDARLSLTMTTGIIELFFPSLPPGQANSSS